MKKFVSGLLTALLALALVPMTVTPAAAQGEGTVTRIATNDYGTEGPGVGGGVLDGAGNYYFTSSASNIEGKIWKVDLATNTKTLLYTLNANGTEGDYIQSRLVYDPVNNDLWTTTKLGGYSYTAYNAGHTSWSTAHLGTILKYDLDTNTFTAFNPFNDTTGGSNYDIAFDPISRKLIGMGQIAPGDLTTYLNGQMWSFQVDTNTFDHWNLPAGIAGGSFPKLEYSSSTGLVYVALPMGTGSYVNGQIYSYNPATAEFTVLHNYGASATLRWPHQIVIDDTATPPVMYISTTSGATGSAQGGISMMNLDGTGYLDLKYYADPVLTGADPGVNAVSMFRHPMFVYGCRVYAFAPYVRSTAGSLNSAGVVSINREAKFQRKWASFDGTGVGVSPYGEGMWNSSTRTLYSSDISGAVKYQLNSANEHCNFAKATIQDETINYGDATPTPTITYDPSTPVTDWATPPTCEYFPVGSNTAATGTLAAGTYTIDCNGGVLGASETWEEVRFTPGTLTVNMVTPTITFTGNRYIPQGSNNPLGLAITVSPAICVKAGNTRWTGSPDPRLTGFGPYLVDVNADVDTLIAGTYTFTAYFNQSFFSGNNNPSCYTATKAVSVQIGGTPPLPGVTVTTPANQNYNYGSTPSLDLTATGTLDSDSSAFTSWSTGGEPTCGVYTDNTYATPVTPSATTPAGSYVIHCTASLDTGSYQLVVGDDATLTVNKKTLTVTPRAKSILTGSTAPAASFYTFDYSGFVNSEDATALTTEPTCGSSFTNATASGSSLTISCGGGSNQGSAGAAANYSFSYATNTLSVIDPTVYVVPTDYNLTYGDAVPAYAFTYYEDAAHTIVATPTVLTAPTCSSGYTTSTAVSASPLTITCSGGSLDGGYTLNLTDTGLVTVSSLNAAITYNGTTTVNGNRSTGLGSHNLSVSLSPATGVCSVTFTVTDGTTTWGPYTVDSSAGTASYALDLPIGSYSVLTQVGGNCAPASNTTTITVVKQRDLPKTPAAPTAVAGNGQATVTVHPNGDGNTTGYLIYAYPGGQSCTVTLPATSCVVSGLTNGQPYVFYARGLGGGEASSDSPASNEVTPMAPPATPSAPPAPLVEPGDSMAKITPRANSNGPAATKYIVTAQPGGATCTVVVPATSCVITGLTNGQQYQFSVVAVNAAGSSQSSASAPGTPFAPEVKSDNKSIEVTVNPSTDGQAPDSYIATAEPSGASCLIKAPATSCVISGLKAGTKYEITIVSYDAAGKSLARTNRAAATTGMNTGGTDGSGTVAAKTGTIAPFDGGKSTLTKALKSKLKALAKKLSKATTITCVGSTSGPTVKSSDRKLALNRALAVCSYLKSQVKSIKSFNVEAKTTTTNSALIRRVVVRY